MRMAAATLARDQDGPRAEAGRVLSEEIDRLDAMARTFAQYGRMPEGPRSEVDLAELLKSLGRQHESPAFHVRVSGEGVRVEAHYDALERSFRNLLLNAAEAMEPIDGDGTVEVTVRRDGAWAEVRIEDQGPGIPAEILAELWNPDVTTKRRGTGLGLAIVRQTVLHHDGTVAAENRPQGGAAFVVRLPAT